MAGSSRAAIAAVLLLGGCAAARSEGGRSWEDRDRLHATLMPYAWRAPARGDALVRDVAAPFDEGRDGEGTLGGRAEVYAGRVGFFLDGFYTTVSFRDPSVEVDARYAVLDFGAAMRVLGGDPWQGPGERPPVDFELDGLALVRTHYLRVAAQPTGAFEATSETVGWADLVLGARGAVVLGGRLSAFGSVDGGAMATSLWRSWSFRAEAGMRLRVTDHLGAVAAWRWYRAHVEDASPDTESTPFGPTTLDSNLDLRLDGPWVGIVLEF
jgi:hypothetical protein